MKKTAATLILLAATVLAFSQAKKTAMEIKKKALEQETVLDTIDYLKTNTEFAATAADRRAILYFTATLQEQLGLYTDASTWYAKAAGTPGGEATNMPKVTTEEIVIAAVRSSLSAGDWETAESYLANIRSSKNEKTAAFVNLYTIWCQLCKASSVNETGDSIAMLQAYSSMQSMKTVRPQVLLTLWYLTNDKKCGETLKREYPASPEASIVKGTSQIMSVPFWYFVPRGESKSVQAPVKAPETTAENSNAKNAEKKLQLGLFRNQKNASNLMDKLKSKGFSSYSITKKGEETGTTYYIVIVDENSNGTMEKQLKSAGFDCYPIK